MEEQEQLWRQLDQHKDLYKFYWGLCLKINAFSLGVAGAISAYYLSHQNQPYMALSLVLPIFICLYVAHLTKEGLPETKIMRDEVIRLSRDALGLPVWPEYRSLLSFIKATQYFNFLVALGLVGLLLVTQCACFTGVAP